MLKKLLFALVIAFFTVTAQADICDDVNDLANDWNDVANFIDEANEDDVFSEREIEILENYVTELAEVTYILAEALEEIGNSDEVRLGRSINRAMKSIENAQSQDAVVSALDGLVDSLDDAVDYCDEG